MPVYNPPSNGIFTSQLSLTLPQNATTPVVLSNASTGTSASISYQVFNNNGFVAAFGAGGGNYTGVPILQNTAFVYAETSSNGIVLNNAGASPTVFALSNTESARFTATRGELNLGVTGAAIGKLSLSGNTSGTASIVPQAAAGTPTLTLPNTSGTFAVSASSPLVLSATTGNLTIGVATSSRSSNTILGTADRGVFIYVTSTFTQTLTAAATLGDGWYCDYRNNGTGIITFDPNSSETFNGSTTWKLYQGESVRIYCNGSNFFTVGEGQRILIEVQTASSSAQLDFTKFDSTRFTSYAFELEDIRPASSNTSLLLRVSTDGGSSFVSSASYTDGREGSTSSTPFGVNDDGTATSFPILGGTAIGSGAAGRGFSGTVQTHPTSAVCAITWLGHCINDIPTSIFVAGGGVISSASVNAVRFLQGTGNIASGTIRMYGLK